MEAANGIEATSSVTDIYTRVTRHIVEALERQQLRGLPWHHAGGLPANAVTDRPYRGINVLVLWAAAAVTGYGSPHWGTFRQWQSLGRSVRRGEKATAVVFWKTLATGRDSDEEPEEEKDRVRFVARGYPVFNADQLDGPGAETTSGPGDHFAAAEHLVAALRPDLRHGGDTAYYDPSGDYIQMPNPDSYADRSGYYSTLAHELTHWTGATTRLGRDLSGRFGSAAYAMEELVAELGSAFLCALVGLEAEPRPDHARYVGSWLEVFRRDTRAVFTAAAKAQAAADWMWSRRDDAQPQV